MEKLEAGTRYWFYINSYENKKKSGLFTGSYDKENGNAILKTKKGEIWSVPAEDLFEKGGKKK